VIVLDTSILILAVGDEHHLRAPAQRILRAHADGRIEGTPTVEVIEELVHVRAQRRPRDDATALAQRYRQAFTLLTTQPGDLDRAFDLFAGHPRLGAFESVLAAVALNRSADALISADRAFADVEGLRWVDPGGPELEALIG
jgi:predicted nucleic acid-binding protein